ncbi:MAG: cytochrome c oxidase assembly protein [Sinobacteraceae bacterium]|nr:cytochrome c oxidase assembly protein [Nevskiaceae bacterium]
MVASHDPVTQVPYCGTPPSPADLLTRFNLDPLLLAALLLALVVLVRLARSGKADAYAVSGWSIALVAFVSPLCALSVALFSARIAQHMVLILVAAPLIALALPPGAERHGRKRLWGACSGFFIALWLWHMPAAYDSTFASTACYWTMHITLFGSAIWLWREILQGERLHAIDVLAVGGFTSMHMGFLGAILTMAGRPLFFWHLTTTQAWGLSPLEDQQLGGVLMWVPGIALFLWAALRTLDRLRVALQEPDAT